VEGRSNAQPGQESTKGAARCGIILILLAGQNLDGVTRGALDIDGREDAYASRGF
jgi:hypothetical protein